MTDPGIQPPSGYTLPMNILDTPEGTWSSDYTQQAVLDCNTCRCLVDFPSADDHQAWHAGRNAAITTAQTAATNAGTAASTAQASATAAGAAASTAQTTASSAATAAATAQTTATTAQTTANNAQTSATTANNAAATAQTTANNAGTAAATAQTTATTAQTAATNAGNAASAAQTTANSAVSAAASAQSTANAAQTLAATIGNRTMQLRQVSVASPLLAINASQDITVTWPTALTGSGAMSCVTAVDSTLLGKVTATVKSVSATGAVITIKALVALTLVGSVIVTGYTWG